MAIYAIVQSGVVANTVAWDGDADIWSAPAGAEAVFLPSGSLDGIGYKYDGTNFTAPVSG